MDKEFAVYYVKDFPIERLTVWGEDGFLHLPAHPRMRYKFPEAILEHIDNTFCEPIQVLNATSVKLPPDHRAQIGSMHWLHNDNGRTSQRSFQPQCFLIG